MTSTGHPVAVHLKRSGGEGHGRPNLQDMQEREGGNTGGLQRAAWSMTGGLALWERFSLGRHADLGRRCLAFAQHLLEAELGWQMCPGSKP